MPASPRSLDLTEAYRRRLLALSDRVEAAARNLWPRIEELDETPWPAQMAQAVSRAQLEGVRLSAGFLAAYLRSESGRGTVPAIDSTRYVGRSRDGRPLDEALRSPVVAVLGALADSRPPEEALRIGLVKGVRFVGFETVQAGRDALLDTIEADGRFNGWHRAVSGTCAACMALSGTSGPRFEVHPGCECVPEPETTMSRGASPFVVPPELAEKPAWQWFQKDQMKVYDLAFEEVGDATGGGYNFVYLAKDAQGNILGKLELNTVGNDGVIGIIETAETARRRGVATKMLDWARRANPDLRIQTGAQTESGSAFVKSLPETWRDVIPAWNETERFPRPTGEELFKGLSKAEQDAAIGPEAAQLVRDGQAELKDFVAHSKTDSDQPSWITQKPAQDVPAT